MGAGGLWWESGHRGGSKRCEMFEGAETRWVATGGGERM